MFSFYIFLSLFLVTPMSIQTDKISNSRISEKETFVQKYVLERRTYLYNDVPRIIALFTSVVESHVP